MAYSKVILCLANSRKISGRCLAGKEVAGGAYGAWIRPISARPTGELSEVDRRYENGQDPKLLDLISVPLEAPQPHGYQSENHLINDKLYWTKVGTATTADLRKALDEAKAPLWDDTSSSYNGDCDRVAEATAVQLGTSLKLIEVSDLSIEVCVEGAEFGNAKRKIRGHFSLGNTKYKLSITDPVIERKYFAGENGTFAIGKAILCISLSEPYQGYAYKLIAAVHN